MSRMSLAAIALLVLPVATGCQNAGDALDQLNDSIGQEIQDSTSYVRGQVNDAAERYGLDRYQGFSLEEDEPETTTQASALTVEEAEEQAELWEVDGQRIDAMLGEAIGLVYFPSGVFIDTAAYGVGEYTQYAVSGLEYAHWVEFAFLERYPDGTELWRVALSERDRPEQDDMTLVEVLVDRDMGSWDIAGARVRTPGITDGVGVYASSGLEIIASMRLQQASFGNYTLRNESIVTPNNAFMTRVISMEASGTVWTSWIFDDVPLGQQPVPGAVVHHELHGPEVDIVIELLAWGDDATALLPDVEIPEGVVDVELDIDDEATDETTDDEETSDESEDTGDDDAAETPAM